MKNVYRIFLMTCFAALGMDAFSKTFAVPSPSAPARHPAYTLVSSGTDCVRLQYRRPSGAPSLRIDSSIYVAIPAGASYETSFESWEYFPLDAGNDSGERLRSEDLSSEEFSDFQRNLPSAVLIRPNAFLELDVLKIQINSYAKVTGPNNQNLSVSALEMEIRWREAPDARPAPVNDLDAGFRRLFRNLCINGENADSLRRKRVLPESEQTQGFHPASIGFLDEGDPVNLANGPIACRLDAVRVRVRETGMLTLRPVDFSQQGVMPDQVQLNQVRIWHRGTEIPAFVEENGDGVFSEGDAIRFFGQEPDSEYTNDACYFLTWNEMETPPRRIESRPMTSIGSGVPSFLSNRRYDDDAILVEEKSDRQHGWYFLEMDERSKNLAFDLPDLLEEGTIRITFHAFNKSRINKGFTAQIFDASAQIEGATAHFSFPGQVNYSTACIFSVSASASLASATLLITLDEEPEPHSTYKEGLSEKVDNVPHLFFDAIEFLYPRKAVVGKEGLVVEKAYLAPDAPTVVLHATGETKTLCGWIVDATGQVVRLSAETLSVGNALQWPEGDWQRLELHWNSEMPGPWTIDRDYVSSLHQRDQGFDYIMVAPRFMVEKAAILAQRRMAEGFKVLLVDVQDIYDEFNYGYPDSHAIRNFFRYAQSEWTGLSPEFILLIGDCTWDHRDRLKTGAVDLLPTYAPVEDPMADASDEWYVYLWGGGDDYFSDAIVGRISVQTVDELGRYLAKVDTYEKEETGPWRSRSVYITDDDDGTFKRFAISNSQQSLPEAYHPHFIHQEDYPLVTNPYLYHRFMNNKEPGTDKYLNKKYSPECARAIRDEFDRGSLLLQYIGHGGNQLWSEERIFYGTDRPTSDLLILKPTTRFPFVVSWSCLTGYLNFNLPPFTVCLSEELIRYPDRGAIAVWGPSGGGTTNKHMSLSKFMLRNLSLDGLDRLGEALTLTKIEFMQEESSPSLVNQYILFGDPAIRLALPIESVPVKSQPAYFIAGREQEIELEAQPASLLEGKAIVSMTLSGEHLYHSEPFDFREGQIRHRFTISPASTGDGTAAVRFYAWNESENRDAWGGTIIPQKKTRLLTEEGTAAWNGGEVNIRFQVRNDSPFAFRDVQCELRMGIDTVESIAVPELAANSTASLEWKGRIDPSWYCAYISIPADSEQGIEATDESKPLIVPLRIPDTNPLVPLTGIVTFSGKDMIQGRNLRMQVPVQNLAEEKEAFASLALSGPGAATDVKDVTLAGGKERRLDFTLTLPEPGQHDYTLIKQYEGGEESYPIPVTVQGTPDLALAEGDCIIQPERPVIGKTVFLKTTVYNVGEGSATDIMVRAYDGDPSLKRELRASNNYRSVSIDRLEPGEMKEVTIVWDPVSYEGLGTHEIHIVVDPQNRIEELSEDNNRSSVAVTLYDLPDLAVDRWNDHGFRAELEGGIPIWGQPLELIGRVANQGDSDAEDVRFTFLHNRKDITHFFDLIPKGISMETRVEIPLEAHKNTLRIIVDRYDLIGEKDEKYNDLDMGNNISEERRMDFQLTMPTAPLVHGRRVYRVTDEATFSAGDGEYLIWDDKHQRLVLHPDLETLRYRIVPIFVQNQEAYTQANSTLQWQWNTKYACFYSPVERDIPLRLSLPAPNGIYDVSMQFFSAAYVQDKTERIQVKTPQDSDYRTIEHSEMPNKNYMRTVAEKYHIRDDRFLVELRPVTGGISTSLTNVLFVRSQDDLPVSGGYLSPYFPAPGSGGGAAVISWNAEIPEGTGLQMKARWVMRQPNGTYRFMPWARIVEGPGGRLDIPGRGDFLQYYANFVRFTHDAATPGLRMVTISIPCKDEADEGKDSPSR